MIVKRFWQIIQFWIIYILNKKYVDVTCRFGAIPQFGSKMGKFALNGLFTTFQ